MIKFVQFKLVSGYTTFINPERVNVIQANPMKEDTQTLIWMSGSETPVVINEDISEVKSQLEDPPVSG